MSIIAGIKEYLNTFPRLVLRDITVDFTDADPIAFGIVPTGQATIKSYFDGSRKIQYSLVLYMRQFTNIEEQRVDNVEFMQELADWITEQDINDTYPNIGENRIVTAIACSNPILMIVSDAGDMGTYQIQINIQFLQGVKGNA